MFFYERLLTFTVCFSLFLFFCLSVSLFVSVSLSLCLFLSLSLCLNFSLSLSLSVSLSVCLSVTLSLSLFLPHMHIVCSSAVHNGTLLGELGVMLYIGINSYVEAIVNGVTEMIHTGTGGHANCCAYTHQLLDNYCTSLLVVSFLHSAFRPTVGDIRSFKKR